jgi:general secretion pathway protein K
MSARKKQNGAALVIVLLLTATLAFVLAAIAETMTTATRRAIAERARADLTWKALAAEVIAKKAISLELKAGGEHRPVEGAGIFGGPLVAPIPGGEAELAFADAGRCFNINSLVTGTPGEYRRSDDAVEELIALGPAAGIGEGDMRALAAKAVDWIDSDPSPEAGGAEDSFYSARPEPYRTGAALFASVSELRALDGVSAKFYRAISPYLCAAPDASPIILNANTLRERDAPLLVAAFGGKISASEAAGAIAERPPGGYATAEQFFAAPGLSGQAEGRSRIGVSPVYIEARARLSAGGGELEQTLVFRVQDDGEARLVRRVIGDLR